MNIGRITKEGFFQDEAPDRAVPGVRIRPANLASARKLQDAAERGAICRRSGLAATEASAAGGRVWPIFAIVARLQP